MRDIVVGFVLLALAAAYWMAADAIPVTGFGGAVSAQGLPKLLAYGLGICSILLVVQSLAARRREAGSAPGGEVAAETTSLRHHSRAAGILVIGAVYALLVELIGFALGILFVLVVTSLYMGGRVSPKLVGVAVVGAIGFWLVFVQVLNIPLPSGFLPF